LSVVAGQSAPCPRKGKNAREEGAGKDMGGRKEQFSENPGKVSGGGCKKGAERSESDGHRVAKKV